MEAVVFMSQSSEIISQHASSTFQALESFFIISEWINYIIHTN